jgi:hypothetical protein
MLETFTACGVCVFLPLVSMCADLRAGHHFTILKVIAMLNGTKSSGMAPLQAIAEPVLMIATDLNSHKLATKRRGWMSCVSSTLLAVMVCLSVLTPVRKGSLYKNIRWILPSRLKFPTNNIRLRKRNIGGIFANRWLCLRLHESLCFLYYVA